MGVVVGWTCGGMGFDERRGRRREKQCREFVPVRNGSH